MARTHHHDYTRKDGSVVTVEYTFKEGSEPTYSPMHGAEGGDACEVEIVAAFSETSEDVKLTDEELSELDEWIACNHVSEPDDFYDPAEWRD